MLPKPYVRHTQYGEWVVEHVAFLTAYPNVYYKLEQLSDYCNLKPTHNFRRQINHLVLEQHLSKFVVQRPEGGFVSVYAKFGSAAPLPTEYWTPTPAPKYPRDQENQS